MTTEKNTPGLTPSVSPAQRTASESDIRNVSEDAGAETEELEADDLEGEDYEEIETDNDSEDD